MTITIVLTALITFILTISITILINWIISVNQDLDNKLDIQAFSIIRDNQETDLGNRLRNIEAEIDKRAYATDVSNEFNHLLNRITQLEEKRNSKG